MFSGYVDLLNKSRGAGARITIGMQTSKDIEAVADEKSCWTNPCEYKHKKNLLENTRANDSRVI